MSIIEKALAKHKAKQKTTPQLNQPIKAQTITDDENKNSQFSKISPLDSQQVTVATTDNTQTIDTVDIYLNSESLIRRGYIFDGANRRVTQEEFRGIKRKLLNNAFGVASKTLKNSNLIMITSSKPNEGKTFVAINLALSIALEQDKTVLLIDADVLRPSLNNELEFSARQGLLEYLLSEVSELSDIIYSTNVKNLKIIPAGEPHNLTNELLASDRMVALAKELAERYSDRIVIFDCPPILGVTETPALASLM